MMLDIIGKRKLIVLIAAAIVAIGIISLAVQGLNFGIDFTGGTRLMLSLPGGFTTAEVRDVLATVEATDASGRKVTLENSYIQEVIGEEGNEVVIRTVPLSEEELETVLAAIKANWPDFSEEDIRNVENVGPVVGGELLRNALLALGLASIAMIIYVSIRFQFNFAVAALLPLLFNSFVVVAVFSLFQIEINSPFVAVILTIVGYSINDTIVIFDRIRENIKSQSQRKATGRDRQHQRPPVLCPLPQYFCDHPAGGGLSVVHWRRDHHSLRPSPLYRDYLRDDFFAFPGQSPLVYPDHEGEKLTCLGKMRLR